MRQACQDLAPLLTARPLRVLDAEEVAALDAHLVACPDCRSDERLVADALATAVVSPKRAPAGARARIEARIASEASAPGAEGPRVRLSCTFCHGGLEREGAVYCAACLAPHHAECFEEHGRCAAPGCVETRAVVPRELRTRRSRAPRILLSVLAGGLGLSIAAAVGYGVERRRVSELARDQALAANARARDEWESARTRRPADPRDLERERARSDLAQAEIDRLQRRLSETEDRAIEAARKADAEKRALADDATWTERCRTRQAFVDASMAPQQKELGRDLFEWQARPDMLNQELSLKDAFRVADGRLTIKSSGRDPVYLGKFKTDWSSFAVELRVKVHGGSEVWFLGRVSRRAAQGQETWDRLPLSRASAATADLAPGFFNGIESGEWATLQYRLVENEYDVVVNGATVSRVRVQDAGTAATGGFGFMVGSGGTVEIEDVKARVFARSGEPR